MEIPIDPDDTFKAGLKSDDHTSTYKKEYSQTSFLLLKNEQGYNSYLMTIIADSTYLKGNLNKLNNNHYNKREKDFSGVVIYHTPQGKFISGAMYKDGKLTARTSAERPSMADNRVQKASIKATREVQEICINFYFYVEVNGVRGPMQYRYSLCKTVTVSEGTGTQEQPNQTGSGQNNDPCNPNTDTEDGGFPPPADNHHNPGQQGGCPTAGTGGSTTVTQEQDVIFKIKVDSLKKRFPCAVALIIDSLLKTNGYLNFVEPFMTNLKPDINWDSKDLSWNKADTNGKKEYQLGLTRAEISGIGASSTVFLSNQMLTNSSKLLIAATAIHETIHAYINYNLKMANNSVDNHYSDLGSWLYGLDIWYTIYPLPNNYSNHAVMLNDYFDKAVNILAQWDNNQHTIKDYRMAMLYGLNNPGIAPDTPENIIIINRLNQFYQNILNRDGISTTDADTFWKAELNAPNNKKLPTTGCN